MTCNKPQPKQETCSRFRGTSYKITQMSICCTGSANGLILKVQFFSCPLHQSVFVVSSIWTWKYLKRWIYRRLRPLNWTNTNLCSRESPRIKASGPIKWQKSQFSRNIVGNASISLNILYHQVKIRYVAASNKIHISLKRVKVCFFTNVDHGFIYKITVAEITQHLEHYRWSVTNCPIGSAVWSFLSIN